jgi:hypothetical protein
MRNLGMQKCQLFTQIIERNGSLVIVYFQIFWGRGTKLYLFSISHCVDLFEQIINTYVQNHKSGNIFGYGYPFVLQYTK